MHIATLLILVCLIGFASAATYTVSPDGIGAYYNLSQAQDYANANTGEEITFVLADGEYGEFRDSTDRNAWVTWQGSGNTVFTLIQIGTYPYYHDMYNRFKNIVVNPGEPLARDKRAITIYRARYLDFEDFIVEGESDEFGTAALYVADSNYINIKGCQIYSVGGKPNTAFNTGIYGRVASHVLVENCEITETNIAILAWGRDWTIRNNNLHDLYSDGIIGSDLADSVIENNLVHNLEKKESSGSHVDALQLFNVNHSPGPGTIPVKNIIIRNNIFYKSDGQVVLWNGFHYTAENIVFENNLIYGSRSTAHEFHVSDTDNLIFKNNTIIGNVIFRGNAFSATVLNNIMVLYGPEIREGVVINAEQDNIIERFTLWTVPVDSNYELSPDTIDLTEEEFAAMFVNAPVTLDRVSYKLQEYEAIIDEVLIDGKTYSTFTVPGINFETLSVFPKYGITTKAGGDVFSCYIAEEDRYACYDLFVWKVEGDTLILIKDITNTVGSTVTISVPYTKSTTTRIHVNIVSNYAIGDVIDYDFDEVAHTITDIGSDSFGDYIDIDVPLHEDARSQKKIYNWGQDHTNVARDYNPLPSSFACLGGNENLSEGEYIGAFPCTEAEECVNLSSLTNYISEWKQGSLAMLVLMQKIELWKSGAGCNP